MRRPLVLAGILFLMVTILRLLAAGDAAEKSAEYSEAVLSGAAKSEQIQIRGIVTAMSAGGNGTRVTVSNLSVRTDSGFRTLKEADHSFIFTEEEDTRETDEAKEALLPGDRILVSGKMMKFEPAGNPGQFDLREYYFRQDTVCQLIDAEVLEVKPGGPNLRAFLYRIRSALRRSYGRILEEQDAKTMAAITLGEKSWMDQETKELFQESGIAHIIAISGLHASLIGMSAYRLLRALPAGIPVSSAVSGLLLTLYVLMSGSGVSAVRALLMFLIRLLAEITGRKYDMKTAVAVSSVLILAGNPEYLLDSSFLLSYGAAASIAFLLPAAASAAELMTAKGTRGSGGETGRNRKRTGKRAVREQILHKAAGRILPGFVITAGMLPLTLWFFYQTPVWSMILNLAIVPLTPLLMAVGLPAAAAGTICAGAGIFLAGPLHYLLKVIRLLCAVQLHLPHSLWIAGRPDPAAVILYGGMLLFLLLSAVRMEREARKETAGYGRRNTRALRRMVLVWLVCFAVCVPLLHRRRPQELEIICMDVGQGDGSLILLPDGTTCLVDGGSSTEKDVWKYRICQVLKYYGEARIDYWFLSHADQDHISGALEFLEEYEKDFSGGSSGGISVGSFVLPPAGQEEDFPTLLQEADRNRIPVLRMDEGDAVTGTGKAKWTISCLAPAAGELSGDSNQDSLVLRLEYGPFCMLFTGDLEEDAELRLADEALITKSGLLRADVLKVGHHGSKYSSSDRFLSAVSPKVSVISCAKVNRYGHPSADTLERLGRVGSEIYETFEQGAVIIRSEGAQFTVNTFRNESLP